MRVADLFDRARRRPKASYMLRVGILRQRAELVPEAADLVSLRAAVARQNRGAARQRNPAGHQPPALNDRPGGSGIAPPSAPTRSRAMIVTVFRSRLRPGVARRICRPGRADGRARRDHARLYLAQGLFRRRRRAGDDRRVRARGRDCAAWRTNPEHLAAQKLARQKYYTEYHIQVCTLDRESKFKAEAAIPAQGRGRGRKPPGLTRVRRRAI